MLFRLKDGRLIRARQTKNGHPVILTMFSKELNKETRNRRVIAETLVEPDVFMEFLLGSFDDAAANENTTWLNERK